MAKPVKLKRNEIPEGFSHTDFKYKGRAAKDQDDFDLEVGIADMACVDQFGSSNTNKYYHAGVVEANGKWFIYLEWGRIFSGASWEGGYHNGQDFQFAESESEEEARAFFEKQCRDKNIKRLEEKEIGGETIWVSKGKNSAYLVQSLSTREKGLPDAANIKDSTGIIKESKKKASKKTAKGPKTTYQPEVISLAQSLVSGVQTYTKAAIAATGISPTMAAIDKVRNTLIPLAGQRIAAVGNDIEDQLNDKELIEISTLAATIVPRQIPRGGSVRSRQESILLSANNILSIQQDLDTFEASLQNENFEETQNDDGFSPHQALVGEGEVTWINPDSVKGRFIISGFTNMSNNRHSYMQGKLKILNVFEINRPDRDSKFIEYAKKIAEKNKNIKYETFARLQPKNRIDISDISDIVPGANIALGLHGTRIVNVQPILTSNLKLPKSLPSSVKVTGRAFGNATYLSCDWKKSYGYVGHCGSYYNNVGSTKNSSFMMFFCNFVMGDSFNTTTTGNWSTPPNNKDSIAAYPEFMRTLVNNEHMLFHEDAQQIKYLIEADLV